MVSGGGRTAFGLHAALQSCRKQLGNINNLKDEIPPVAEKISTFKIKCIYPDLTSLMRELHASGAAGVSR